MVDYLVNKFHRDCACDAGHDARWTIYAQPRCLNQTSEAMPDAYQLNSDDGRLDEELRSPPLPEFENQMVRSLPEISLNNAAIFTSAPSILKIRDF